MIKGRTITAGMNEGASIKPGGGGGMISLLAVAAAWLSLALPYHC